MKGRWESKINVWFRFLYPQCSLFLKQNYNVLSPNFHIHKSVSDLYIPRISLPILLQPNRQTDPGNIYKSLRDTWHRNLKRGHTVSFLETHKSDFRYSVPISDFSYIHLFWCILYLFVGSEGLHGGPYDLHLLQQGGGLHLLQGALHRYTFVFILLFVYFWLLLVEIQTEDEQRGRQARWLLRCDTHCFTKP